MSLIISSCYQPYEILRMTRTSTDKGRMRVGVQSKSGHWGRSYARLQWTRRVPVLWKIIGMIPQTPSRSWRTSGDRELKSSYITLMLSAER